MPSAFDLLGTVFGLLSLLGCLNSINRFLVNRQPLAQTELLEDALREARQRIDELDRYGYLSESPALSAVYRSALAKIDRESLRVRAQAEQHRPKSIVAVLAYSWQHGVNCTLSRQIGAFTKLVRSIRKQLDYPVENPYIDYSVSQGHPQPGPESGRTSSTDSGNNVDAQSEHRDDTWASDPPLDAEMASQVHVIRERRMQSIQGHLEAIATAILRSTEVVYDLPAKIVRLNQQLIIDQGAVPSEESILAATAPEPTESGLNFVGLVYTLIRILSGTFSGQDADHDTVIGEIPDEVAQREATKRKMDKLNKWFQDILDHEFSDPHVKGIQFMAKMKRAPWDIPMPGPSRMARVTVTPTVGISDEVSTLRHCPGLRSRDETRGTNSVSSN